MSTKCNKFLDSLHDQSLSIPQLKLALPNAEAINIK